MGTRLTHRQIIAELRPALEAALEHHERTHRSLASPASHAYSNHVNRYRRCLGLPELVFEDFDHPEPPLGEEHTDELIAAAAFEMARLAGMEASETGLSQREAANLERLRSFFRVPSATPDKVNLDEQIALIPQHWHPRIVGELNGQHVKLARLHGEFIWHHHETQDELFLVLKGTLRMRLRGGDVSINEGEFLIVPRGVEHQPVADEEVHVLLFEPAGTLNTGNVRNELTVENPARVGDG
jgi:mannose-6-phosphate isomerase-like protein (cupin superfamily)